MTALHGELAGFLLVLFRCSALFAVAPVFGSKTVPARARLAVALAVSFAVFAGAGFPAFSFGTSLDELAQAAAVETLIGLCTGASVRVAMDAAMGAGHITALSMGIGFGAVLDPVDGAESTSVGELVSMLALAAFMAAGGHREMVAWLCRSFAATPPGSAVDLRALVLHVVTEGIGSIALAVRLAYPVMAAVLVGQVLLGVLSRAAPALNIGSIGFSVSILAGGGIFYVTAPLIAELAARAAVGALARGS